MKDKDIRCEAGSRGRAFAESYYGEENILGHWDNVLGSIS